MRSPTCALLWEIWRHQRVRVAIIAVFTVVGRIAYSPEESSSFVDLLWMLSFLLLFGIFSYTDSSDGRGPSGFPHRLFILPVSSVRLVAVPVIAGITAVELLYLLWLEPISKGGSTSAPFVAVLLAAFMVFYQAMLWMLARVGPIRLVMVGAAAIVMFGVGILPSFPPSPPPPWRSEVALAGLVAGLAVVVFLLAWRHVVRLRSGGGARRVEPVLAFLSAVTPTRRRAFASPAAAHFWFEWRSAGVALPMLVAGVLLVIVLPFSWAVRHSAADSWQLLLFTLATPIILAVPVGMGFSKPAFWSEDLAVPSFVAVRPLTVHDFVAIRIRVAAASAAISWLLMLTFVALWLSLWANLDAVSRFAIQLWAFHGQSVAAVFGITALIVIVGMLLTWRFLVSRLWSGLSGSRPLFAASVMSVVIAFVAHMMFDCGRLLSWIFEDPERLVPVVWIVAVVVIAKYWLAAYSWRDVPAQYGRHYLFVWGAGTTCFLALTLLLWGVVRIYVALDIYRVQSLLMLLALSAVPLGRLGLAPSRLARNRHR